jgi:hypothetical protein
MKESTSKWLKPLETAADKAGLDTVEFFQKAKVPASDSLLSKWVTEGDVPGVEMAGIDWIRYGQLIRDALGWNDYPKVPEE